MAQKTNLVIDQGTTYTTSFQVSNSISLTSNSTVNSQIRKTYTSSNSVAFTASANNTGWVTLSLSSNATANIVAGRYVYDVEVTVANSVYRVAEGIVTVTPQVTR